METEATYHEAVKKYYQAIVAANDAYQDAARIRAELRLPGFPDSTRGLFHNFNERMGQFVEACGRAKINL